jgi:hypothetical protein
VQHWAPLMCRGNACWLVERWTVHNRREGNRAALPPLSGHSTLSPISSPHQLTSNMRSRDYECWVVDVTSSEEGSQRVEEGAVPLVRKLSDTSRHARASLVLQAGRKVSGSSVVGWQAAQMLSLTF